MTECFWTGFINCAEPSCGGDTPEPPPVGVQHIAVISFDPTSSLEEIEASVIFGAGYEYAFPGYSRLFDCLSGGRTLADPVDLFSLGYSEIRVGGTWYNTGDLVPLPDSWTGINPCDEVRSCPGVLFHLGPLTVRFRGGALPEIELPLYIVSDTCF